MNTKLRIKFLFIAGLLLAITFVALQSFEPATALHSQSEPTNENIELAQDNIAADSKNPSSGEKRVSIADLKKENEELTRIQDELIKRFIKLRREHDLLKEGGGLATGAAPSDGGESVEVQLLRKEKDELKLNLEAAQVQIEKLTQEKQGKLRLNDELSVVNAKARNLQTEAAKLEADRSKLELELSKAKSELESLKVTNRGVLQELEGLRSQFSSQRLQSDSEELKLKQQMTKLESDRAKLEIELAKTQSEFAGIQAKNREVMQEVDSLRSQIASHRSQSSSEEKRLRDEAAQLSTTNQRLSQELSSLRAEKSALDTAIKSLRDENDRAKYTSDELSKQLAKEKEQFGALNNRISELEKEKELRVKFEGELAALKTKAISKEEESDKLVKKLLEFKAKIAENQTKITSLEEDAKKRAESIVQCETQLNESKAKVVNITELERQVVQLQNELLLKKTELEIYSSGGDKAAASPPASSEPRVVRSPVQEIRRPAPPPAAASQPALRNPEIVSPSTAPREMIIEITANKGQLRSGPGKEHGVMMHIRQGARLVVEDRQGEWFRVLTPTGTRAYVNQEIARIVGESPSVSLSGQGVPGKQPTSVFGGSPEEAAMQQLKRGVSGR